MVDAARGQQAAGPATAGAAPHACAAYVHECNVREALEEADAVALQAMFSRVADDLLPIPPLGANATREEKIAHEKAERQRVDRLRRLIAGSGRISGDRYELWLNRVRHGSSHHAGL
jgi:hypothetical protein